MTRPSLQPDTTPPARARKNSFATPYRQPLYYEIAFSFFDVPKQADLIERFVRLHGHRTVRTILDIACGPSLQLREFARRGYHCIGLDRSREMLGYVKSLEPRIETVRGDFVRFALPAKVDLAFIMMGSLMIRSNTALLTHLDSVAGAMHRGGLYIIENAHLDWVDFETSEAEQWTASRDGIEVKATYDAELAAPLEQLYREWLLLEVDDHGRTAAYRDERLVKAVFPQEFKSLVALHGKFEFVGFFERCSTRRLKKARNDNLVVLRRK
jgi:SAM-dependent methyltransferase